ncbi:hypothetical protein ACFLS1_06300 [Verrucomicrobiota bacterium]
MRKTTSILLLVITVFCLWTAGLRHEPLLRLRAQHHLAAAEPLENAPPLLAFTTIALGGFRGLLVDVMWLRVSYLQEQGRYYELVQLSDWITKLEPRATEIWIFHARNMAYNISVMMPDPENKWRWVRNGVLLLRDEGLIYNPGDSDLYCEIGWLFQHKIGGRIDNAAGYYKDKWAQEMNTLWGGARPDYQKLSVAPEAVRRMKKGYKLFPDLMREIELEYGQLDWRLPESHAIYWAYRGKKHAGKTQLLSCDRMIFQSMSALFKHKLEAERSMDLLPGTLKAYEEALKRHEDDTAVKIAYRYFLGNAVISLNQAGFGAKAREIFGKMKEELSPSMPDMGFEEFLTRAASE